MSYLTIPNQPARLDGVLMRIANEINLARENERMSPGLSGGGAGHALYLAYLSQLMSAQDLEEGALTIIQDSLDAASTLPSQFYGGATGVMWSARQIDKVLGTCDNTLFCRDLDEMVLESLQDLEAGSTHFDLIAGLVGIGAYALSIVDETCGREIAAKVLDLLMDGAQSSGKHIWWYSRPGVAPAGVMFKTRPNGYADLGVAHGNAGVALFLAQAIKKNVDVERCTDALLKVNGWIVEQKNVVNPVTRFGYIAEERELTSRAAWCYGDLGMAWSFACAGDALGVDSWTALARDMATLMALRDPATMGFGDAALCHGSAGVAHIMNRLSQHFETAELAKFGGQMLMEAFCSLEAAQLSRPKDRLPPLMDMSYLEGDVGIGLALMSALRSVEFDWDYPLMLA